MFATCGSDKKVRVYDEKTRSLVHELHAGVGFPGHSNRVFCVKFDPLDENVLFSGGWDKTVQIYDMRQKGPVMSMLGPMITGDSIDVNKDDHTLLTGCYMTHENLRLWDLRNYKCHTVIDWMGKGLKEPFPEDYQEKAHRVLQEGKRNTNETQLYSAMFTRRRDHVIAGGCGKQNEVKMFNYKTGDLVAEVLDVEKSVLCMDYANTSESFSFGTVDSKVHSFAF